jgi:Pyruvate/2-oxoacid:ferredoxin oxidoreductase delta subunit
VQNPIISPYNFLNGFLCWIFCSEENDNVQRENGAVKLIIIIIMPGRF